MEGDPHGHVSSLSGGELRYEQMCRERIWEAIDPGLSPEDADDLFAAYIRAYESAWRLFDDVSVCLSTLRSFRLGIISNGRSAEQRKKPRVLGIENYFDHVALSEETGFAKPECAMYLGACASMGVTPESVVFVGDSFEIDYVGARAAGMSAVWLDRPGNGNVGVSAVRISSLEELPVLF